MILMDHLVRRAGPKFHFFWAVTPLWEQTPTLLMQQQTNETRRHLKELERDHPRKENVLSLLRQTYSSRRDEILSDSKDISVTTLLSTHPALSLPYAVCIYNVGLLHFPYILYLAIYTYLLQVEQEIDLVLGKKGIVKAGAIAWMTKWTPAILQHSDTLTGKLGAIFKQNQMACHGTYMYGTCMCICICT